MLFDNPAYHETDKVIKPHKHQCKQRNLQNQTQNQTLRAFRLLGLFPWKLGHSRWPSHHSHLKHSKSLEEPGEKGSKHPTGEATEAQVTHFHATLCQLNHLGKDKWATVH